MFENIKELFQQEKTKKQIYKLLLALIVCLFFLLIVEILFQILYISDFFGTDDLE